jgi:hypothetical protein
MSHLTPTMKIVAGEIATLKREINGELNVFSGETELNSMANTVL